MKINPLKQLVSTCLMSLALFFPTVAQSAEKMRIVYGSLDISFSVDSLDNFARTGKTTGNLNLLKRFLDPKTLEHLQALLSTRYTFDRVTTYKISRTSLAEDFLQQLGKVVQTHSQGNGFYAIRGAIVTAAGNRDGWTLIDVMRAFPTAEIYINGESLVQLKDELALYLSYQKAAATAVARQSESEATTQETIDLAQLPDLRETGLYRVTKETLSITRDSIRQTGQGLTGTYRFDVDVYLPQDYGQPAPVILISHGFGSLKENFTKLAQHLASHGFVVAIPEHIGSDLQYRQELLQGKLSSALSPIEYIDRPRDLSDVIDKLEQLVAADANWARKVNLKQIGAIGDSLGATTVLSLAGAELNIPRLQKECASDEVILSAALILQCQASYLPPANYNLYDPRIKAVMATHPLSSAIFGPEGLRNIQVPILIATGSNDILTPAVLEQIHPFIWLQAPKKHLLMYQPGGHFSSSSPASEYTADYIPEALIGKNRAISSRYFQGLSVAFMEVYLRDRQAYLPYLSAAYSHALSNDQLRVHQIQSLTPKDLETAYGKRSPIAIIPSSVTATVPPRQETIQAEIKRTGVLKVAYRRDANPFGYIDRKGRWVGYCSVLTDAFANYLQKQLDLAVTPEVVVLPSTLDDRFELVQDDRVHLECGPNTIRNDVAKVSFSLPFFTAGTYFLIPSSLSENFNPNQSLTNFKVGVLNNTTNELFIQERYPEAKKVFFEGETGINQALDALENRQIDAFMDDGILLIAKIAERQLPQEQYQLVPKIPLTCDYYGLILPDNEPQWNNLVDRFLESQTVEELTKQFFPPQIQSRVLSTLNYCLNLKQRK